jgi:hypothetical protein
MNVKKLAIMIAIASSFSTANLFANDGLRQPVSQTGFEYSSYYNAAADQPVPAAPGAPAAQAATQPAAPAAAPAQGGDCGCNNNCGCNTGCEECKLECPDRCPPWRLFGCHNENNCHDINQRGWVNGGIMTNFDPPASNFNGPVTFADRDEPLLNQAYYIFEKQTVANTEQGCIGWGGRLDLMWGSDYRFNISRGLSAYDDFTAQWDTNRFYGLDIPQMYAEVGNKRASLKLGHFYTIIGFESVMAPENFFYTHAYTMQYGEPFTHTGTLATFNLNDQVSFFSGITNGWDNFEEVNQNHHSILNGVTFTASDKHSKLALANHYGKEEVQAGTLTTLAPLDERSITSMVYSRDLTDRLQWVIQSDIGYQENVFNSGQRGEWYGVNQYLFYKKNCCWTYGLRAEWFRDDDGFRVAPAGDYAHLGPATNNNPAGAGGFQGDFFEISLGANWKPYGRPNLTIRPELRYDWYNGPDGVNGQPFDDGAKDHQWLSGFDVIYVY